ncbi:MAG: DUF502 domain-containing protein [Gammaproteobacteria bacterium]|nr:DUF502 domain-containing protein [Gammaproteobacteria bacterium]
MLRRYLIAGVLVWVPLGVTFFVLKFLLEMMDKLLLILPIALRPESLLGFSIPGLGFILAFIILLITGAIGANLLGQTALRLSESLLSRIPLVRTIYSSAKQILNSVLSNGGDSFRKVLLIEYPRKGIWTICFQTGTAVKEIQEQLDQQSIMVFVPTTPNPTSGFIMVVAESETRELDMDIETALKLVMSLGMAKTSSPASVASR